MSIIILVALAVSGLIFGSFINALVWRLRQKLDDDGEPKKLSNKDKQMLSIFKGRSICPNCKHQLAAKDLVPVFSWLQLKGRCRYCQKSISKQYPIVEAFTAIIFGLSYVFWPYELTGYEWFVFGGYLAALVYLIAMAIYDLKYTILPSVLIYSAILTYTIVLLIYSAGTGDFYRLGMAFASAILFFAVFLIIFLLSYLANKQGWSSKEWLGFGDVRLAFLLGLLLGEPFLVFFAMFASSLAGIIVTFPSLANNKINLTAQIPFGPFLIAGTVITIWWGNWVLDWYSINLLGL